jgi:superfamily II DNA helicase RecQ
MRSSAAEGEVHNISEWVQAKSYGSGPISSPLANWSDPGRSPWLEAISKALSHLYGEGAAPKSQKQLELCIAALEMKKNVVAVLPTSGGKSAAWLVPAVVMPSITTVVIVPYKELLAQHLEVARGLGLRAERWTAKSGSEVPESTNLLFMACETAKSAALKR